MESKGFLRLSAIFNGLFVVEAAIGFLFDILIIALLGVGASSDALYAAWMLPQTIGRGLFQSLTNSFMGIFGDKADRHAAYGGAIVAISCVVLPFSILLSVTSGWWLPWTIPGAAPSTQRLAVDMARILAYLPALLALAEMFRAIFYVEERLYWPSIARVVGGLFMIALCAIAFMQGHLLLAAWAILIGAGIEAGINLFGLARQFGLTALVHRPDLGFVREMLVVGGGPIAGLSVRVAASVAERALASLLPTGGVTLVTFAVRIISSIERFALRGFVLSATASALQAGVANIFSQMRTAYLVALPISLVLAILARPFVRVLFGFADLGGNDVAALAQILAFYALGIIILAASRIPFGYAFAYKESGAIFWHFVLIGATLILVETLLIFGGMQIPAFGLGFTAALLVGLGWLYRAVVWPRQHNADRQLAAWPQLARLVAVGALAAGGVALFQLIMQRTMAAGFVRDLLVLGGGGAVSVALVLAGMILFRLPEADVLRRLVMDRLRRGK